MPRRSRQPSGSAEAAPCQPHLPTAASSSQYHGGATHRSHNQTTPSAHEHMYAGLASSWQSPHYLSQAPGPSSALLQRLSPPSQRQLPGQYLQYAGPTDYVNQPAWPANYARQEPHGWSDALTDECFPSRPPATYGQPDHDDVAPPPHLSPDRPDHPDHHHPPQHQHHHHHAPDQLHHAHFDHADPSYDTPDRHHHIRMPQEFPASAATTAITAVAAAAAAAAAIAVAPPPPAPVAPPSANAPPFGHHGQKSAPVADLLNYTSQTTASLPVDAPQLPPQMPMSWPAGPSPDVPPMAPQQHLSHTTDAMSAGVAVSGQDTLSSPTWAMLPPEAPHPVNPVYDRIPEVNPGWTIMEAPPANGAYLNHIPPLEHLAVTDNTYHPSMQQAALARVGRRTASRKSLAKVPASFSERQPKQKVSRRKGALQPQTREKASRMRKGGNTCVRCRFYKAGCDEGEPCQKCLKVANNARSFREPCSRDRIEDASLVRRCNGRFNQEEAEFLGYDWIQGGGIYEMAIIWNLPGYGPIMMAQPMRIHYREYLPRRAVLDTATSVWRTNDGEVKAVQQPPYAVYDTASLIPAFEKYFFYLQPAIETWIFDRIRHDEIASLTYTEVMRLRRMKPQGTPNLLDLAVRLQCISIVSQGYGTVWSNNIPGIQEYDYRKLGKSGYEAYDRDSCNRPLPGAINHQMDVAALKYLKKLEKHCVKELSASIFKPKVKPWYELFLAFFALFWNLEYIHHGAERYIMSKNGTLIENQVSGVVRHQIAKWDFAFPVLMSHWRCILRDYRPFKLVRENPDELRQNGGIDEEGFQYVRKIASIFDRVGVDRFPPPLTEINSMSSKWIMELLKSAGV